jgi:S-DNA-T family DNA segregation ATPase FtsK/SpoIIIE
VARAASRRSRSGGRGSGGSHWAGELVGVALIAVAGIAALALATYVPSDPLFRLTDVANGAGALGATLAGLLRRLAGWGGSVLVGVAVTVGARLLLARGMPGPRFWWGAALLLASLASLPPLLALALPSWSGLSDGGVVGNALAAAQRKLLSVWGALLLDAILAAAGALAILGVPSGRALRFALRLLGLAARGLAIAGEALGRLTARILRATLQAMHRAGGLAAASALAFLGALREAWQQLVVWRARRARRVATAPRVQAEALAPGEGDAETEASPLAAEPAIAPAPRPTPRRGRGPEPDIVEHHAERSRSPEQEAFAFSERTSLGPYQRPDVGIFQQPPDSGRRYDRESLIMNSRILEKKLADFGVNGRVVTVHPGPVITMYEFEPASGVKVNRITSLADDLALALRALSVRIIAPLPGKSVVGIEIPNPERDVVYLRDLLESESFRKSRSKLTLALGKDIFGNPVDADLARMPHLLVAGATGTGKSVFLNALLCSILFRVSPDELKLLLVDPKILELSIYEGIPHLIADVVTNPKRAAAALHGIVQKMEERYQMMAALGVRNINQFNDRVDELLADGHESFQLKAKPGEEQGAEVPLRRLAYIVVVIDELADLMVVSARDVEEALQRLAQMARAAGIHLVLATQRPSVDVLTGVIKANFPSRIAFQVASRTDSRTILDQNGAEHLLGQGDMLYLPPGTSKLQRIHGAYVSEKEVGELVAFLRQQGAPQFDETLLRAREESEKKEERGEDVDDLYDRAIEIVAETRNASISYIQRRLKIGYNRAARMIEQMETDGVVGPQEGTKSREVFVRPLDAVE